MPSTRFSSGICVAVLLAVISLKSPGRTFACTLCVGFPDKTVVDFLSDSQCVILARPATDNPFSYAPKEILKGAFDGVEIDLLVDSMTRRSLAVDSDRVVLLVQEKGRGKWRSFGLVSEAYLRVVRRVVMVAATWKGEAGRTRRWQFFLPLFGDDDPRIRELAYLELGSAPYTAIRKLGRSAPPEIYAGLLDDPRFLNWRSLAILLRAQSEDPMDKRWIRESFGSANRFAITTNLAALAAAAIEVDGLSVIDDVDDNYCRQSDKSIEEIQAILKALSMHASIDDNRVRERVVSSYRLLLESHPTVAARIAEDLSAWGRYDLKNQMARVLTGEHKLKPGERRSIMNYIRMASKEEISLAPQ